MESFLEFIGSNLYEQRGLKGIPKSNERKMCFVFFLFYFLLICQRHKVLFYYIAQEIERWKRKRGGWVTKEGTPLSKH